jgi:hypothetical protein
MTTRCKHCELRIEQTATFLWVHSANGFTNCNLKAEPVDADPFHDEGNATNHRVSQCSDHCLDHLPEGSH